MSFQLTLDYTHALSHKFFPFWGITENENSSSTENNVELEERKKKNTWMGK